MSLSWQDEQHHTNNSNGALRDLKLEKPQANYVPPASKQTVYNPVQPKRKKKSWLLWPIAWTVFIVFVYLVEQLIEITFHLGILVVGWLSTLPTIAVILLTLAFGGIVISLLASGIIYLPSLAIGLSDTIYHSKLGVRYYFVGFVGLILNILVIISAIRGHLETEQMFWVYARYIYSSIMYIVMLFAVRTLTDN